MSRTFRVPVGDETGAHVSSFWFRHLNLSLVPFLLSESHLLLAPLAGDANVEIDFDTFRSLDFLPLTHSFPSGL